MFILIAFKKNAESRGQRLKPRLTGTHREPPRRHGDTQRDKLLTNLSV
jgi:hypothetical protein